MISNAPQEGQLPSGSGEHPALPRGMGWGGVGHACPSPALSRRLMLDHSFLTHLGSNMQALAVPGKPSKGTAFN